MGMYLANPLITVRGAVLREGGEGRAGKGETRGRGEGRKEGKGRM